MINYIQKTIQDLEKEGLYPVGYLLNELDKAGYFKNRISFYKHEKSGKILPPSEIRLIGGKKWRLYTKERIKAIIENLKRMPITKFIGR